MVRTLWLLLYRAVHKIRLLKRILTGDVVYAEVFGSPVLVLNSLEAVNDLIDKRASTYSSRPQLYVIGELMNMNEVRPLLLSHVYLSWALNTKLVRIYVFFLLGYGHDEVRSEMEEASSLGKHRSEHCSRQEVP